MTKIIEAKPTVKDKVEVDWDTMFDEPTSKGELSTDKKTADDQPKAAPKDVPKLKVGTKADTAKATAGITPTDAMRDLISKINVPVPDEPEEPSRDVVIHEPVTTQNVPAVISKEIALADPNMVQPTWHAVANLPGNMSRAILTLGKALFASFTKTPTKDIVTIANLGGQGPNSNREIQAVANWISKNGIPVDTAKMDFGATIPGYDATVKQYSTAGVRFMLVKDQFGQYIYAWPEQDSHQKAKTLEPSRTPHRSLSKRTQ